MLRPKRPRTRIHEVIEELHLEANQAIRERDVRAYERTVDVYVNVLLAFPRAWQRYGERFEAGLARDLDWLGISPIDQIETNLFEELLSALRSGSREIARAPLELAFRVMAESVALKARALWIAMLRFLRLAHVRAQEVGEAEIRDLAADHAIRYQFELGQYYAARLLEDDAAPMEDREMAADYVKDLFESIGEMMKAMLRRGDLDALERTDNRWSQVLEYWQPEYVTPREFEVQFLEQTREPDDPEVILAREAAQRNARLATLKQELVELRQHYRFALTVWAFRSWQVTDDQSGAPFRLLAEHFSDPASIADGADIALRREFDRGTSPLSAWLVSELPEGQAAAIPTDSLVLTTFLALLLKLPSVALQGQLPTYAWVASRRDELEQLLTSLEADPRGQQLAANRSGESYTAVRRLLTETAQAQQAEEAAALRDAPLDAERLGSFQRGVEEGWRSSRLAYYLFDRLSAIRQEPRNPRDQEGWFGQDLLIPKGLFVEGSVHGGDLIARDLGRNLSHGEMNQLIAQFREAQPSATSGLIQDQVLEAAETQRSSGFQPSLLIMPFNWRLEDVLGLGRLSGPPPPPPGWELPEGMRQYYQGTIEDVVVLSWPDMPFDRIYLLDLRSFATWLQWPADPGREIRVRIHAYEEQEAINLAGEDDELLRQPGVESVEDRARKLRENVLVSIRERFTISVDNRGAVVYLAVPEDLRET